ncbi:hypothetical protein QJ856_gp0580 [Tupanvirus deep ocean]|uniref:Uncharacterized protein n=2 Tax=Tupanvirus TaxID=2094720 RepID=A0AC62A8R3_9VIRU|nr:hypothetical protein QJ856_gp0580 [Tupanvirus deep ocean]QKU34166.1 hypothetical protein [Tupanvirus deep ocean]
MEDIINIGTFIQHLTYYIKIGIYINKGTDKDATLERCIKLYNKYKTIEASKEISEQDETFVRKCLKRLNLILKVNSDGSPVDITNKENQLKMVFLKAHPSLANDDLKGMLEHAAKYNITILTEIPLLFVLRESKYQELLWQYTRSLFYISQYLISKVDSDADPKDKIIIAKQKVMDDSFSKLESILITISETEEKIKINEVLSLDKFLNSVLIKTGINESNVNEARQEVKDIFNKKGLGQDNSMTKMIDLISDNLTKIDLSGGNIIQSMFGIAQNVAQEMRCDLEKNPEKFQSTIGAITEVFQEAMNDTAKDGEEVPSELKNMFNQILSVSPMGPNGDGKEPSNEDITKSLESIIQANGLDRDKFYESIKGDNEEIDIGKLEKMLMNLGN